MKLTRLVFGTALAAGAAHVGAKEMVRRLGELPDPFTMEELMAPFPGDEFYLDTSDGTKLRTMSHGSGSQIVFAHGYGVTSSEWNLITERMWPTGRHVIGFDQRGHGGSTIGSDGIGSSEMASDYKAVLEHYDVRDGVLVAHSMGTFLAIKFLLDHPEVVADRLKGVVLVSPFAGDVAEGAPQTALQIPMIKSGFMDAMANHPIYGTLFASTIFGNKAPSQLEVFRRDFCDTSHKPLIPILEAFVNESNYGRLSEIDIPVRVICGTNDMTTPPRHSERIAEGIPGATLTWVDGAGHSLNWEAIDEVIAEITHFDTANV